MLKLLHQRFYSLAHLLYNFLYELKTSLMFSNNQRDYISLPSNKEEHEEVMGRYRDVGLPGAMGSVDVVHCKWGKCPAGDFNCAKGKEGYPTLAFQCISDFDRRINGIFGPQSEYEINKSWLVQRCKVVLLCC